MLRTKAILVKGETKYLNGGSYRDLDKKVEKAIDEFLVNLNPDDIVDVKVNTEFTGVSGDQAFILILYKGESAAVEVKPTEVSEVAKVPRVVKNKK